MEEERSHHTNEWERGKRKKRRRDCKNGEMIVRCVSINDIDGTGSSANSGEGGACHACHDCHACPRQESRITGIDF